MTCPVPHDRATPPRRADESAAAVARFERVTGSVFLGLFAVGLFDQTMLPSVSAALETTGRVRDQPWGRAIRTAAADQLFMLGDDVDRLAEARRLLWLHRDVKGAGPHGERYSALHPQSWNWVLYSTFFMQRGAYLALTGDDPSPAENQAIWDHFRNRSQLLELPGRSRLIEDYDQLVAHYDRMVADELRVTPLLESATTAIRRAPRPDFLPAAAAPLWHLISPAIGHVVLLLGCGIMHPGVRARMPMPWTPHRDREFQALTTLLRTAFHGLPTRVTDTPLARNRRQYNRLVARYRARGLESFA
ncbi:oxygenase MpaB family protein [Nocardia sp. NPDC003693]